MCTQKQQKQTPKHHTELETELRTQTETQRFHLEIFFLRSTYSLYTSSSSSHHTRKTYMERLCSLFAQSGEKPKQCPNGDTQQAIWTPQKPSNPQDENLEYPINTLTKYAQP
jgi:hypothetical protein